MRSELMNGTLYKFKVKKTPPVRKITEPVANINTNAKYYLPEHNINIQPTNDLTVQKHVLNDILHKVFNLQPFTYNKNILNSKSIDAFKLSKKQHNDKNNKIREHIIGSIINNQVPENYYILNNWLYMKDIIFKYLKKICDKPYIKVECIHKSGRNHHYDFLVIFYYNDGNKEEFKLELKFNAESIDNTPQFVSPMKPSQYLNNSYEEYYYDNYLKRLSEFSQIVMPTKEEYLKQIHSNTPKCMKPYQDLYYRGCSGSSHFTNKKEDIHFYHFAKELSNESISSFINNTELDIELISKYLYNTQENKIYMLYSGKSFILQKYNIDDYRIDKVHKNADKYRYECISKSGKTINILLRWKNGNGIAFPAFQIS